MSLPLTEAVSARPVITMFAKRLLRLRFVRFGLVGASGVVVNMTVLFMLVTYFGLSKPHGVVIAWETALLANFLLNDRWTFSGVIVRTSRVVRLLRYHVSALLGLGVTFGVFSGLTHWTEMPYLMADFTGIAVAVVVNYKASQSWTWAVSPSPAVNDLAERGYKE